LAVVWQCKRFAKRCIRQVEKAESFAAIQEV